MYFTRLCSLSQPLSRGWLLALALILTAARAAGAEEAPEAKVMIVATGGTIAGVQDDPKDPTRYRAGSLSAEQIIESVPGLARFAQIETLQFSNIPSTQITPADWVRLSVTISSILNERDDIDGVIVTHGTDRLEESAWFLHLTVASDKPVIIVGAQRPATNASADGPANLLAAVKTAVSPESRDRGVMVVMDERILSARQVRKDYPRVGGFGTGLIGLVGAKEPAFLYRPSRPHTQHSEFRMQSDTVLPDVDLVFSYSGGRGPNYVEGEEPAGVVITTTNMTCAENLAVRDLARRGVPVVSVFPTGESLRRVGEIEESAPERARESCSKLAGDPRWEGAWIPPLPAQMLTPQKARILLMLALNSTRERSELERIFSSY
ncbi:MAG: asparaginase [Halieaceae bacterium]|nr:asparaginase [Halieaceae bacterium]